MKWLCIVPGASLFIFPCQSESSENWWSHSKRGFTAWVIDFFKTLVTEGKLALGNHLHMECVWFVFSDFLQLELDKVKDEWNMYSIGKSRHNTVSGVPDELYYLPQTRGFEDCGFSRRHREHT